MAIIYFINVSEYDGVNSWNDQILHTTNKKQLDDIADRNNKKHKNNDSITFTVKPLVVCKDGLTRDDIKGALQQYD